MIIAIPHFFLRNRLDKNKDSFQFFEFALKDVGIQSSVLVNVLSLSLAHFKSISCDVYT